MDFSVSNSGRNGQFRFRARARFAPEFQPRPDSFRALADSRQSPVPPARAFLKDRAVFSVFRHASEFPIYRIEKCPRIARRQGAYSVVSATGHILRRGQELDRVLGALDCSLRVVAG